MSDEDWNDLLDTFETGDLSEVDDILERWLNGEDVSDWEDDGSIAEIKEDEDDDA